MILVLSASAPPGISGSSVIVANLAKQFRRDEMIVVGERPAERLPLDWHDEWPRIVHATRRWPADRRGSRWWRRLQLPWLFLRTLMIAVRHRCTVLITVYPRAESVLVGYLVARVTGIRFFLYFHNLYRIPATADNHDPAQIRDSAYMRWLQRRAFDRAEHVFVMSEGMEQYFRDTFPDIECSPLLHSFNEEIPAFQPPPCPGTPLKLAITGNINQTCADAAQRIVEAVSRLDDVSLTLYSGTSPSVLADLGLLRDGVERATLPRAELLERLPNFDALLLPHGLHGDAEEAEIRTIFPTRTIEYLISGRPILAHAPADSFLAQFLRKHDCALVVSERSEDAIIEGIQRLRGDTELRARLVQNALRIAQQYRAPEVACVLRKRLGMPRAATA